MTSRGSRSLVALGAVLALCAPSGTRAQESDPAAQNVNPVLVADGDDEVLVGTLPVPGFSAAGLFRLRSALDPPEVLRAHGMFGLPPLPRAWFRVRGDGAFVGADGSALWRLDATGPERRIAAPEEVVWISLLGVGQARGIVYLSALTSSHGFELWRTDGTAAGTRLVRDIARGAGSSQPRSGVTVGSVVFFAAETAEHGRELWRTDGTSEGTVLVADLRPGSESSSPVPLGRLGGELLFAVPGAGANADLWLTDGSREGTRSVAPVSGHVVDGTRASRLGGSLAFAVHGESAGSFAAWVSDGSPEGTFPLLPAGTASTLLAASEGRAWLAGPRGLWITDGTPYGAERVWVLPDEDPWARIVDGVPLAGGLVLRAVAEGRFASLWFSDGTPGGTSALVGDGDGVFVEIGSSLPNTYYFGMLASTGDAAWFAARTAVATELWVTDGTAGGTRPAPLGGLTDHPAFPAPPELIPFADGGPEGPEPAPPTVIEPPVRLPLDVTKLRIDLRLGGIVDLRVRALVPLAGEQDVEGETLVIDVGGILTEVVLDRRGRARTPDGRRVRTRVRRGRGDDPDELRVDLRLRRAPVGSQLLDEGLSVPEGETHVERPIDVEIVWREVFHTTESRVRYRQRKKRGIAKLID